MSQRKGVSRPADVPDDILHQLNSGTLETMTLAEGLAVNFAVLLRNIAPEVPDKAAQQITASDGITKRMTRAAQLLLEYVGPQSLDRFATHPSDTVRGWAAYMLAQLPDLALGARLESIRPLANDHHFGVREWAWLALRPHIANDIEDTIRLLTPWVTDTSPNIRRFAVESTRPRGVWCSHIPHLKRQPELGLPLLEPVKADASRYVQDSVSNWLNDAAKSQPQWVQMLCARWQSESDTPATTRICTRALRSIKS